MCHVHGKCCTVKQEMKFVTAQRYDPIDEITFNQYINNIGLLKKTILGQWNVSSVGRCRNPYSEDPSKNGRHDARNLLHEPS